jgi:hypothetical protein
MGEEPDKEFFTTVAGVSHHNRDGASRQEIIRKYCYVGQELELIREPDNPHDPHAVGLWITTKGLFRTTKHQIGYLPAYVVERLIPEDIEKGRVVRVFIKNLTGNTRDKPIAGINIRVEVYKKKRGAKT